MKQTISSLELKYLLKEIQVIVGGKVDKIYHPRKKELFFSFHVPSHGKVFLRCSAGKMIYMMKEKPSVPNVTSFCAYLRNQLGNAKVKAIEQVGIERVVKITFEAFE